LKATASLPVVSSNNQPPSMTSVPPLASTAAQQPLNQTTSSAPVTALQPTTNSSVPLPKREAIVGVAGFRSVFRSASELGANSNITQTQEKLQPLFVKPKLTDKLLAKPPFRFIFDIVFAVFESTGFGQGLFTNEEKDSEMVKEKEQKMAWLDKLINLIGVFLNSHVAAKSKSIVAGLEPELTNEMLQMLAIAATLPGSGNNSTEAVKRVLAGEQQPDAHGTRIQVNITAPVQSTSSSSMFDGGIPAISSAVNIEREVNSKIVAEQITKRNSERSTVESTQNTQALQPPVAASTQNIPSVSNAASSLTTQGSSSSTSSSQSTVPARPHTARRRPPRIQGPTADSDGGASSATSSGGAFFVEGKDDDSDGDGADDILAGHAEGGDFPLSVLGNEGGSGTVHGKHTREILAEREQQQQLAKIKTDSSAISTDDGEGGVRLGKMRTKTTGSAGQRPSALAFGELEGLQEAIQKLARSVTPVGNSLDFIPEDADEMRAELRAWRGDYQSRKEQQERETRETEEALAPFKRQLADAEEKIRGQAGKIAAVKDTIIKNDARIAELLRLVVTK
jgi:TRAF3-interacting protein 1